MRFLVMLLTILVPAAAVAAEKTTVRITGADCARLVEHRPSADVAYKPGIDVRGRKVAPADVPASPALKNLVPRVLEFPVSLNPLKGGAARFGETSLNVGNAAFDMKTGKATFNGQPLTRGDTRRLARECKRILRKTR
jgi:hypothetical protein